ncbi:dom34 [Ecytonucleospora hepatopenaei]|uniref:Dom34 n=1 Tax=Ecytonucleospora hepatopenaei TaxID=646526 RepID=A0A1W0E6I8_9MICR|nr:dom34 [Ecytonucleospora hepatopenaei]
MIIYKNETKDSNSHGKIALCTTNTEDCFCISQILQENDKINSKTTRKVSFDGGKTQKKIKISLEIQLESFSADLEHGILYLKGKVSKENEFVSLGSYHTLNIEIEQKFTIEKNNWTSFELKLLKDATKISPEVLFLIFYENTCNFMSFGNSQNKVISKCDVNKKNFKPILNTLLLHINNYKTNVVVSCFKTAEQFCVYAYKQNKIELNFIQLSSDLKNAPASKIVSKVILNPAYKEIFANCKYYKDILECKKYLNKIKEGNEKTFLGFKELKEAFDYGAIENLFITDILYRPSSLEKRKVIERLINEALSFRAKIFVVPVENEVGEELDKLGGIAGTLSFTYK